MHITLFAFGSWGDVRPLVVLGMGLKSAGHEVQMAASPSYEDWVRARSLDFYPLTDDVNQIVSDLSSTDVLNPIQQIRIVREVLPPVFTRMGLDVLEATRESDALLTVEFSLAVLLDVIRRNRLKPIVINPAPLTPTMEFPSAASPRRPAWFPRKAFNRLSYRFGHQAQWSLLAAPRRALQQQLNTSKTSFADFRGAVAAAPTLTVVSPTIVPRPKDWKAHQQVAGYLFDNDSDWTPPKELSDFLAAGDPPVYIGFGSMADSKPEATTRMLIEAVQRAGKRAVILSGWARLGTTDVPDTVHITKYASHAWLFPRMAAVVHHGGAGTTAAGLRAGVPMVIVPHNADQPYWGRLVKELGVGPGPTPSKKLNAEKLSLAIEAATSSGMMRANAQALGDKIEQEDGLSMAVEWVEQFLRLV